MPRWQGNYPISVFPVLPGQCGGRVDPGLVLDRQPFWIRRRSKIDLSDISYEQYFRFDYVKFGRQYEVNVEKVLNLDNIFSWKEPQGFLLPN